MDKKRKDQSRKELRINLTKLLKKADDLKLLNNATYNKIYDMTFSSARNSSTVMQRYADKLEYLIETHDDKKSKTLNKKTFEKVVVVPKTVKVLIKIKGLQVKFENGKTYDAFDDRMPKHLKKGDGALEVYHNVFPKDIKTQVDEFVKNSLDKDLFKTMNTSYNEYSIPDDATWTYKVVSKEYLGDKLKVMSMFRASYIKYQFLPTDYTTMNNTGTCVYECILSRYKLYFPKMNADKLLKIVNANYTSSKSICDGLTITDVGYICTHYKIPMYAFDQSENLQLRIKPPQGSHHYPPLVFFAIDNHMYMIINKPYIESVCKRHASKSLKTEVFESETKKENKFERPIYRNLSVNELKGIKDSVVIYDCASLKPIFLEIFKTDDTICKTRSQGTRIIEIDYNSNLLCLNPNYNIVIEVNDDELTYMNWKDMKKICDDNGIEFRNQSMPTIVNQIKDKVMKIKSERILFTQEERLQIKNKSNGKCNNCETSLKKFHVDHIIPLASGGTNDDDNLQALCIECHRDKTIKEKELGDYIRFDPMKSSFNPIVSESYYSDLGKHWAFVEFCDEKEVLVAEFDGEDMVYTYQNHFHENGGTYTKKHKKNCKHIDIIKSRRNKVLNNKDDYPVFSVLDDWKQFDGVIKCALYYVETSSGMPLRGNGFYYYPLVRYCIENNIIAMSDIKMQLVPSTKLEANALNETIDTILKTFPTEVAKQAVNSLIGLFGKTTYSVSTSHFTRSKEEAGHFGLYHNRKCIEIEDDLLMMYNDDEKRVEESNITIYDMIIDMEIVELHKLKTLIEHNGGEVVAYMTDCVSYTGKTLDISKYKWENGSTKYRHEHKEGILSIERKGRYKRSATFEEPKYSYNIIHDVPDNDFKPLIKRLTDLGSGCMIDARAGCGKTYLINQLKKVLPEGSFVSLAPTNKACRILGDAKTLHKFYNIINNLKASYRKEYFSRIQYIFIDEVSMMKEFFYKFFLMIKKESSHIKFILSGDWRQCEPVKDRYKGKYKNTYALHHLVDGNMLELELCRRSDSELFEMSKIVKAIDISKFKTDEIIYDNLCFTNDVRKRINTDRMHDFIKYIKSTRYQVYPLKKASFSDSQDILLCKGMPVISRVNNKKYDIVSNETFIVKKIEGGLVTVGDESIEIKVPLNDFQNNFNLAFCITVDKSQGSTYNMPIMIHEWKKMDENHKYTAFTRSTSLKNVFFA